MVGRIWMVAILCAGAAVGQTVADRAAASGKVLAFGVVSIRQDVSGRGPGSPASKFGPTPDGYSMTNIQLLLPILTASIPQTGSVVSYGRDQIVGLPDWVMNDRFDIAAKVSLDDLPDWEKPAAQPAMLRAMLQSLLMDRCKLAVHREVKETAVYSLMVAKRGPKFKPTNPDETHPEGTKLPWGGVLVSSDNGIHLYGTTMKSLAAVLSQMGALGRTVEDKTGLAGEYDIVLKRPNMAPPPSAQPGGSAATDPSEIVFAIVDSVGLKMESTEAPVETLVIDHIEKPSEN